MIDGIYAADFVSNRNIFGHGIVVFDGGRFHGGDMDYLYKGKYRLDQNKIIATVDIENYTGHPNSIFGAIKQFRLTLNGVITPAGFSLSGQVDGHPHLIIRIDVKKLSVLVEQD